MFPWRAFLSKGNSPKAISRVCRTSGTELYRVRMGGAGSGRKELMGQEEMGDD